MSSGESAGTTARISKSLWGELSPRARLPKSQTSDVDISVLQSSTRRLASSGRSSMFAACFTFSLHSALLHRCSHTGKSQKLVRGLHDMCNLYSKTMVTDAMRQLFAVDAARDGLGNAEPLPATFPKGMAPSVGIDADGRHWLQKAHWGFVMPQVSKKTGKPIQPKAVNNARDDKLRTSSFWRQSFEERRCLIPATSFCEAKGRNPATYVWFGVTGERDANPLCLGGRLARLQGKLRRW